MQHSHSSLVNFPFLPNLLAKGLGLENQLIADPLRYERTNKIFFSSLGNAYGQSQKCKLQASRKLQSFHGSEPSKVSGSQTLTFLTLGGAGGCCRAMRFWAKCCKAPKN